MRVAVLALGFVAIALSPASADDETDCRVGIEMIKAEIAKKPSQTVLTKLQTSLRVAEREQREREFDECMDAVKDARKTLGR